MIFSEMVRNDLDSDTGYGISTDMCDNGYPIIVINPSTQMAWLEDYIWGDGGKFVPVTHAVTFEMLVNATSVSHSFADLMISLGGKFATV